MSPVTASRTSRDPAEADGKQSIRPGIYPAYLISASGALPGGTRTRVTMNASAIAIAIP